MRISNRKNLKGLPLFWFESLFDLVSIVSVDETKISNSQGVNVYYLQPFISEIG